MKTYLLFLLSFFSLGLFAQGTPNEKNLSPEFSRYLTDNNLWENWRSNRQRFECPKQKSITFVNTAPSELYKPNAEVELALANNTVLSYYTITPDHLEWGLEQRAASYKAAYTENPQFFKENGLEVLTVLDRLPPTIKTRKKIIVTDITGSMSPYIEQVLLWHKLQLADDGVKKYVFFNDGNTKPNDAKMIGKTGGIYTIESDDKKMIPVISLLQKGMTAGGGGDDPENDLEALLRAQEWKTENDAEEIILIADAFSEVRDLELLSQLKVPVRVILCGIHKERKKNAYTTANASLIYRQYQFIDNRKQCLYLSILGC